MLKWLQSPAAPSSHSNATHARPRSAGASDWAKIEHDVSVTCSTPLGRSSSASSRPVRWASIMRIMSVAVFGRAGMVG